MQQKRKWAKPGVLWTAFLVVLLVICALWIKDSRPPNLAALYTAAVTDAVMAEPEEIESLVVLSADDTLTTWDEKGHVLLLSWHCHPERYIAGEEITLSDGAVWTFTDREIAVWYEKNKGSVKNWELRLEQLIGLPPDAGYTHMSGFWAEPKDVVRPAYVTDIRAQMQLDFPDGTDKEFQAWFDENSKFSYEESAYPWTRLGYTYDWADNGTEYGLTEFLIKENSPVQVAFTKTTKEFLTWLGQGAQKGEMK